MTSVNARRVRAVLRTRFAGDLDRKGYTRWPQENLVSGVRLDQFEDDLRQGDGNELRVKFCAVHSSAALAVNSFARFKHAPQQLNILGNVGATALRFERQLKIITGRNPANLDIWIERPGEIIAIESKFLEYFEPKKAEFAEAYERLVPPESELCWWAVYQDAKAGVVQHLDRAQLIKHYFGLRKFQHQNPQLKLTLLYLFWEPLNWQTVEECTRHRNEVETFSHSTERSTIAFRWMTYAQLWDAWAVAPHLQAHAQNLKARYEISL